MHTRIEFAGLPGSGKTTLARHKAIRVMLHLEDDWLSSSRVARSFRRAGRVSANRVLAFVGFCVRSPVLTLRALQYTLAVNPSLTGLRRCAVFLRSAQLARRDARGVSLSEEGPVQAIWSIGVMGKGAHPNLLPGLLRAVYVSGSSSLFVFVECTPEVAASRASDRENTGRFDAMSFERRLALLTAHSRDLEGLAAAIQEMGLPVIRISGNLPVDVGVRVLLDALTACGVRA